MDRFIWRNHLLPRMALGTVQLGLPYGIGNTTGQPDFDLACEIVKTAWENGIHFFDTAQAYGQSERVLGRVFAELDINDKAEVIIKFGVDIGSKSVDEILAGIEQSRLLLGVPKFFGVMLHQTGGIADWYKKYSKIFKILRERGTTSFIGVSIYTEEEINLAFELPEIDLIQVPFNVFDQRGIRQKWFERAHTGGKLVFIRSIYLQGLLLLPLEKLPPHMEFARSSLKRFHDLCRQYQLDPAPLALGYVAQKISDTILLFGAETPAQILENVSLYNTGGIPRSAIDEIDSCFADLDPKLTNPSWWPT